MENEVLLVILNTKLLCPSQKRKLGHRPQGQRENQKEDIVRKQPSVSQEERIWVEANLVAPRSKTSSF